MHDAQGDMTIVHATAIVDPAAQLDSSVTIGPYAVIGPHVKIGAGTAVGPHTVIEGHTTIGQGNRIFQFASIGAIPQDKKYSGEPCELVIGDRNTIREFVTFNIGSPGGGGVTRIGSDNWIMAYVHIAHDCQVGDDTTLANNTTLAGHVEIGDFVTVGGLCGVHQFTKVGAHAMVGFSTAVSQDVPPYMLVDGNPMAVHGVNVTGLKRRNFSGERIRAIRDMYKLLYRENRTLADARTAIDALSQQVPEAAADVALMSGFLARAERGIAR